MPSLIGHVRWISLGDLLFGDGVEGVDLGERGGWERGGPGRS